MANQPPKIYTDVYPFLEPGRYKGAHAGKNILITGAGRGIGQHIAQRFAMAGAAAICVADLSLLNLGITVELCLAEGSKAYPFACDVSKEDHMKALVEQVVAKVGSVDVLVNCAGVCTSKPILMDNFASIWREVEINLGGPLLTMTQILPIMKAQGHGVIINIVSRAGTVTVPFLAGYSISKSALIKATDCIQKDLDADGLGDTINLYCCHPGAVQTDLSQRPMDPEVAKRYPQLAENRPKWIQNAFKTQPALCAATCVFLATGKAAGALKGRYIDCEHDMEAFVSLRARDEIVNQDLHTLRVGFLGGLPNDGGSSKAAFKFNN